MNRFGSPSELSPWDEERLARQHEGGESFVEDTGVEINCWHAAIAADQDTNTAKVHLVLRHALETHFATEAGRAYLEASLGLTPRRKLELITIERRQFEAMLQRIEVLEAKAGIPQVKIVWNHEHIPAFDQHTQDQIADFTNELFGGTATVEPTKGDDGEELFFRVTVGVGMTADPRGIATKRSEWHDKVMELGLPKSLSDNLRLKVVYE